jgi:hypothetical protein
VIAPSLVVPPASLKQSRALHNSAAAVTSRLVLLVVETSTKAPLRRNETWNAQSVVQSVVHPRSAFLQGNNCMGVFRYFGLYSSLPLFGSLKKA